MPRYRFTGTEPEDFHDFGRLEPGAEVETPDEVYHARLEPIEDKPARRSQRAGDDKE